MEQITDDLRDPAGEDGERENLRARGQFWFVVMRGIVGFGGPVFLWLAISHIRDDVRSARQFNQPVVPYLLQSWATAALMVGVLGCVVGVLAWKRLVSDYWPGRRPDPESSHIRLGL